MHDYPPTKRAMNSEL